MTGRREVRERDLVELGMGKRCGEANSLGKFRAWGERGGGEWG